MLWKLSKPPSAPGSWRAGVTAAVSWGSSQDSVLDLVSSDMKLDLESCLTVSGELDLGSGEAEEQGAATCKQNVNKMWTQ